MCGKYFLTDVTITFVETTYPVREDDGMKEVCVEVVGNIETSIVATLTTSDGTARGNINH